MYKHAVTIYLFINDTSILTGYYIIIISQKKIQVIKNLVQWYKNFIERLFWSYIWSLLAY